MGQRKNGTLLKIHDFFNFFFNLGEKSYYRERAEFLVNSLFLILLRIVLHISLAMGNRNNVQYSRVNIFSILGTKAWVLRSKSSVSVCVLLLLCLRKAYWI